MQASEKIVQLLKTKIGTELTDSPSAVAVWLRGILRDVEAGKVEIEYTIREDMTNPAKTLHGGMASAFIDDAIGLAVHTMGNQFYFTTVNLYVDFLSVSIVGEKVIAKASVLRQGSRLINATCILYGTDGRMIARGTSNLIVTSYSVG